MSELASDVMTAIDWGAFWNTFLATVFGAAIALGSSMWLTRRERPRPMWRLEDVTGNFSELVDDYAKSDARIVNIGNGDAHNVLVSIKGADPFEPPKTVHLLHPGESVPAAFCFNITGHVEQLDSEKFEDHRVPSPWPEDAYVLVQWQQAPNLNTIQSKEIKIGALPEGWNARGLWPSDLLSH